MNETERLGLSQRGIDAYVEKARDYGKMRNIGVNLGEQQLEDLRAYGEWPPVSEHIRRAIDLYLAQLDR